MAVTVDRAARLERSVGIDAPIKDVWAALLDLERVVLCLPGVAITDVDKDGAYHGTLRVKFGPRTTVYRGTLRLEAVNRRARRAVVAVSWSGQAARIATATVVGRADAGGQRTRLHVVTEFPRAGRMVRLSQSAIAERASERLLREFAARLAATVNDTSSDGTAPRSPGVPMNTKRRKASARPQRPPSPTGASRVDQPWSSRYGTRAGARWVSLEGSSLFARIGCALSERRAAWLNSRGQRALARARACPTCGAHPGRRCRRGQTRVVAIARTHPARGWRERACPSCPAQPGEHCLTASGRKASTPHAARLEDPRPHDRGENADPRHPPASPRTD